MISVTKYVGVCLFSLLVFLPTAQAELTQQEQLGKFLFFDETLSEPDGQSCASCHAPDAGFADPDTYLPVSEGVIPGLFGDRNSPAAAYASFFPDFSYNNGVAIGGQFWDGRAANVVEQAKGPFLNPVEMANPDKETVIRDILLSDYRDLFEELCSPVEDIDAAYDCTAEAIGAYEGSSEVNTFTSKFDYVMAGKARFTRQERRGMMLFNRKARCAQCHTTGRMMGMGRGGRGGNNSGPVLFTDFRYHNLGLPKNTEYPYDQFEEKTDLGLGGFLNDASQNGKFKTPHLRNIALTPPYMHNGVLKTLKDVVHFYNTRDVSDQWDAPEVSENMERRLLGNLGLSDAEEDAIVAFMMTFTDGYVPEDNVDTGNGGNGNGNGRGGRGNGPRFHGGR